jgi:hypothetical protein
MQKMAKAYNHGVPCIVDLYKFPCYNKGVVYFCINKLDWRWSLGKEK